MPAVKDVMVEFQNRDDPDGTFWATMVIDGEVEMSLGPFAFADIRDRVVVELLNVAKASGGIEMPLRPQ